MGRKWLWLLGSGVSLLLWVPKTLQQGQADVQTAFYKGSKMCVICHRMRSSTRALVTGYVQTAHAKAMQEAVTEGALVADFAAAPFPKERVAYAIGSGRTKQSYLTADFQVLSHRWNTVEKKWEEDPDAGADARKQCLGCHVTGYNPQTQEFVQPGVGCESCHGPGSEHLKAPTKDPEGRIVRPQKLEKARQAMICGRCHSKGQDPSGTYAFPVGYQPGGDLTRFFVDAKPIAPGRNQQYSEMLREAKHLAAGTVCETCHDPHGNTQQPHQLRQPINDLCLECHQGDRAPSAIPEHEAQRVAKETCAGCHLPQGQHLFALVKGAK
ncbi:MAG TPA: hypothetical protein EYP85_01835 [Armatimonadetes bacterium]|nr:hypothetical protein [Armatimonadota bacterium]